MYKLPFSLGRWMLMDLALQRREVAQALQKTEAAIGRLVDALAHRPVWANVAAAADESIAIRQACEAYAAIDYAMNDAVGESVVCLGVIGVPSDVLRRAQAVNTAKHALKKVCAPLQKIRTRIPIKGDTGPTKAVPVIRVILRNIQRSDLNLLAAYRKIPILEAPPATVTYTRAHTRAVYRKTVDEVMQLLTNLDSPAACADRARVETLDPRETHLALVRERYQNIRANVLYTRLDRRGRGRMQIAAELPVMYASRRRAGQPVVQFPVEDGTMTNQPQRVRQAKLTGQPFLHSLPVYRYARTV